MEFQKFSLDIQNQYDACFEKCSQKTADYIFFNLWAWNSYYNFKITCENEVMFIHDTRNNIFRAPVGDWEKTDFTKLSFFNEERTLHRVPEKLKDILLEQFKDKAIVVDDRANDEYLYSQQSLATLAGNKMHKKKNHFNAFKKTYEIDYRPFSSKEFNEDIKKDLEALEESWCTWNDCLDDEALQTEYHAIKNLLAQMNTFPQIVGGALYVENQLIAFSIGEKLDDTTFLVHFEKAHPEYRGSFQAINKCFAEQAGNGYEFINREQDLGMEGLRQAKLSYHPSHYLKKFTVTIKV